MFFRVLCVISFVVYTASSAPLADGQDTITSYEYDNDGKGNYKFSYETSKGLKREETGQFLGAGTPSEHLSVSGQFSYVNTEGNVVNVSYAADEKGYRIVLEQPEYASVKKTSKSRL